jgi:hypothetical protein
MAQSFDDPATMTPEQRRREIASILASGVLRLFTSARTNPASGDSQICREPSEIRQNCLDLSATSSPHVDAG